MRAPEDVADSAHRHVIGTMAGPSFCVRCGLIFCVYENMISYKSRLRAVCCVACLQVIYVVNLDFIGEHFCGCVK